MKSSTLLHSALFHLTPTRTRCDLIIMADGKQEKIASGLLNPFVAHLKTAQEQIAKGGYSIVLEPQSNRDTSWFTKGTLERFVRFVGTPEILERVYSIESEIQQIEEGIVVQGRNDSNYTAVIDSQGQPLGSQNDQANEEKAIVLYKVPESDQNVPPENNSRVQLFKVLETRKNVLQKEQGMAFARAVAAGFEFNHMAPLLSFAECFGAERLMNACKIFMDLWKKKLANGQWPEMDTPEPVLNQSEYLAMRASGIMLASVANKHQSSNDVGSVDNEGERAQTEGQHEHFQGQFPHPMYPWPMHSPGTAPMFPAYPVQGMPYYPAYPGNGPYYHPPYFANGDSCYDGGHKTGKRRQSAEDKDGDSDMGASEVSVSRSSSLEAPEFIKKSRKKAARTGKRKSGVVVIRNINYITPEAKADKSTESGSGSESETSCNEDYNNPYKTSNEDRHTGSVNESFMSNIEDTLNGKDSDAGHWQAFQKFLLRSDDEETLNNKDGMFSQEQDVKMQRHRSLIKDDDSLLMGGRDVDDTKNWGYDELHEISGNMSRRNIGSNDDFLVSGGSNDGGRVYTCSVDMQSTETNGKRVITKTSGDDFVVTGRRSQSDIGNLADPFTGNGFDNGTLGRESKKEMGDESFIVPFRSLSLEEVSRDGRAIDVDAEFPLSHDNNDDKSNGVSKKTNYEPDALSLMPERVTEGWPSEYDPALDYGMQDSIGDERTNDETDAKEASKKSQKEHKSKVSSGTLDKKRTGGPVKKEKPSRMNLLEDARARAEKLRSFKADIQKIKKEKEEADKKRIEALKLERQKRIAARANPASGQKPVSTMQTRKLPSKFSSISHGGSKFSDTEPGASSPLQRTKIRTLSLGGSSSSQKPSKATKMSNNHMEGNRHTRSVSSLTESQKEGSGVTTDSKASMARIRRLSEPKASSKSATETNTRSAEPVIKQKSSTGSVNKNLSANMKLDKSKATTLHELKIKASGRPSDVKVSQKSNGTKSSSRSLDTGSSINNEKRSLEDVDDNPIIEKTVVMLEYEKPSVTHLHQEDEKKSMQTLSSDNHTTTVKSKVPAPPFPVDIADKSPPAPSHLPVQSNSNQVAFGMSNAANSTRKEFDLTPSARNSSLEEPCTGNSEYGKTPPVYSDMGSTVNETDTAHVTDGKTVRLNVVPDETNKTHIRESPKGFRRILKFGKKSHTFATGKQSVDLDNSSVKSFELDDKKTIADSSNEVYTLKNLISQDESTYGVASQKSSRKFSLLAPFRGKSSEKKLRA